MRRSRRCVEPAPRGTGVGHSIDLPTCILPAHRLPNCDCDGVRGERKVVRGAHGRGRWTERARAAGRQARRTIAGDGNTGKDDEQREASTSGQDHLMGAP